MLQPVGHAFILAREDIDVALAGMTDAQCWLQINGIATVGYHLAHLAGSTDRLMTYARGEPLTDAQQAILARERAIAEVRPSLETLLGNWHQVVTAALRQLATTPESALFERRAVGRERLPSNVHGLLFHAAEHAARHTGQIVTTAKLVRTTR
ncbi:MAG TPA: DinB family protein [Gemmatimonadales bacterium]|nr:DinB family protein [Gemmatimonadales bacterium]